MAYCARSERRNGSDVISGSGSSKAMSGYHFLPLPCYTHHGLHLYSLMLSGSSRKQDAYTLPPFHWLRQPRPPAAASRSPTPRVPSGGLGTQKAWRRRSFSLPCTGGPRTSPAVNNRVVLILACDCSPILAGQTQPRDYGLLYRDVDRWAHRYAQCIHTLCSIDGWTLVTQLLSRGREVV